MPETALLAALLAGAAGVFAGRVWAKARTSAARRPGSRAVAHFAQALHYLVSGQLAPASTELQKVARVQPEALEVQEALGQVLRELGQVERAIAVHQQVLTRRDLSRPDRARLLAALGTDFRKAGFLDRATRTYAEALEADPNNTQALIGRQRLFEEQRQWREASDVRKHLGRIRKSDESLVMGFLQAELGRDALRAGRRDAAEAAFREALELDARVFPARLGLADLSLEREPRRAWTILEEAALLTPEKAYLTFERLLEAAVDSGEPERYAAFCERLIAQDPRDWRARLALARYLRTNDQSTEAFGLLLRAMEANPHAVLLHLEIVRTLRDLGVAAAALDRYLAAADEAVFYRDPHVCTVCHYRADGTLWRCPHCHAWGSFVEERVSPLGPS